MSKITPEKLDEIREIIESAKTWVIWSDPAFENEWVDSQRDAITDFNTDELYEWARELEGLPKLVDCDHCHRCLKDKPAFPDGILSNFTAPMTMMILCPDCGNKRCPHASDHRFPCSGSNEPGQLGSVY